MIGLELLLPRMLWILEGLSCSPSVIWSLTCEFEPDSWTDQSDCS